MGPFGAAAMDWYDPQLMNHPLGQACALLSALVWAFALVLFKRSGERIGPLALNLYKNVVGLVLLGLTLAALALRPGQPTPWPALPGDELCLLLLSGAVGIALADTLFLAALNLIGVGLLSIVDCLYTPFVILFSWLLLSERLTAYHYVGAGLILLAITVASRPRLPVRRTRKQVVGGILLAAVSLALMALGIVIAKPSIERLPLVWSTTVRLVGGVIFLALFGLLGSNLHAIWTAFRPSATWKYALPGSVLGTYVCLLLWIAGFKYTHASVAAVLNQTTIVFASLLAALLLKEHFGRRQCAALLLALGGVVTVTSGAWVFDCLRRLFISV